MSKNKNLAVLLILAISICSCSSKYYYVKGLKNAQNPTPGSVYNKLTEITPSNKDLTWKTINGQQYVLAITWKADTTYYTRKDKYDPINGQYLYNTGGYPIFVTAAPYLKEKHLNKLNDKKLTARLDQLLGLPPTSHYSYFLEVWVKPEDLIRPCFDPAIDTNVCEFTPSKKDNNRGDYLCWLYQYIYDSYSDPDMLKRYPFSHLGYTYDWSPKNKSHVGLSEFVIGKNKDIYVKKVYTTRSYIGE